LELERSGTFGVQGNFGRKQFGPFDPLTSAAAINTTLTFFRYSYILASRAFKAIGLLLTLLPLKSSCIIHNGASNSGIGLANWYSQRE
jgi:hypothetical protein